jgi:hypothetical protein
MISLLVPAFLIALAFGSCKGNKQISGPNEKQKVGWLARIFGKGKNKSNSGSIKYATKEVEKIIKHRTVKGGQYEYQVLWKKNQTKSWLKFEDFNSTKGISQYWRSKHLDLNCLILNQKKQKSEKLVFFERKENWIKKVFNLCIKLWLILITIIRPVQAKQIEGKFKFCSTN